MTWGRAGGGGTTLHHAFVQVGPRHGYQPDVAWWPEERSAPDGAEPGVEGPPPLVVEVLSPSTRLRDLLRKPRDYARVGVAEMWLVDTEGPTAAVLRRDEETSLLEPVDDVSASGALTSPMLPGLEIPLADLLRR